MNIPNALSISRIVLIPLFLYFIFVPEVQERILALAVFIIASLTDLLDGWSARRLKQETSLGKFLDPLADKFLVISAMIAFLILDPLIPLWMILIIISREILLTLMRYIAIKKNMTIRTTKFGKIKTAFQMISIILIIMVLIVRKSFRFSMIQYATDDFMKISKVFEIFNSTMDNKWLIITPYCLMAMVTILTALSGIRYIITNRHIFMPALKTKENKEI